MPIPRPVDGSAAAPYYRAVGDEVEVFLAAARHGLPVLLKGPTGCGKTRFVEAMAHEVGRDLVTVAGHEDLTSADLVGRFLLKGGETVWVDGPLTRAVREGAICYLDEVVEARQDTTVVIHPLTDHRRQLPVDRLGVVLDAAPGFQLVISYNPGYQSVLKDLKDSTRQRFVAIELGFPRPTSRSMSWPTRPVSTATPPPRWWRWVRPSGASRTPRCGRWPPPGR
jgi:nitric oxide reductase NorQ protein